MKKTITTTSATATQALGRTLAKALHGGEVLALQGTLGAGKTTFIKGLARGLGVRQTITSPTFVLMKVYTAKKGRIKQFVHVDCYRLPASRQGVLGVEFTNIGLGDYLGTPSTVVAIEWADKLKLKRGGVVKIKFRHTKNLAQRTISW
jgi:tRNA threonylcarbamoyladenosine biosynthesis protein TsaE